MAIVIDHQGLIEDAWTLLPAASEADSLSGLSNKDVIVPLSLWLQPEPLQQQQGRIGVWLDSHELPAALADTLAQLPLIALNFPEFRDGRAFSSARELRQRHAYQGDIRAIGDVARDQLFFMKRCGFSSFMLRDDQDLALCLGAFSDFREAYQPAIDQPLPLFRRRTGN